MSWTCMMEPCLTQERDWMEIMGFLIHCAAVRHFPQ